MPATITLIGENDTDQAFNEAIQGLDRLENEAQSAGLATDDLNKEMESRAAGRYANAVKEAADALDGTAEKAREAERELEKVNSTTDRNITAAAGIFGIVEGLGLATEAAEMGYEALTRWAEAGDEGAQKIVSSLDQAILAINQMGQAALANEENLSWMGQYLQDWAEGVEIIAQGISGLSDEELKANQKAMSAAEALSKLEEQRRQDAKTATVERMGDLDAVNAKIRSIEEDLQNVQGQEYNVAGANEFGDITEKINELRREGYFVSGKEDEQIKEQIEGLKEKQKQIVQENQLAKRSIEEQEELTQTLFMLEEQRKKLTEQHHAQRVANVEEQRELHRQAHQERVQQADALADKLLSLTEQYREGMEQNDATAREQEREEIASILEARGKEEELHDLKLQWIEEEYQTKLAQADSAQEQLQARLDKERELQQLVHGERMEQIQEAAAAEEEAARRKEEFEQKELARLQGLAEDPTENMQDRRNAIMQVMEARTLTEKEEFMGREGTGGLSERELNRAMHSIEKRVRQQTMMDARSNRLHTSELGQAQEALAANATRQAEASGQFGGEALDGIRQNLETSEELIRNQEVMANELNRLSRAAQGQAQRARAVRGGLKG